MQSKTYMYAINKNKELIKLFTADYYERDDETYYSCHYKVADCEFFHSWECEKGFLVSGNVPIWPLPYIEEYEEYLKGNYAPHVEWLLRFFNINQREIPNIEFVEITFSSNEFNENTLLHTIRISIYGIFEDNPADIVLAESILKNITN